MIKTCILVIFLTASIPVSAATINYNYKNYKSLIESESDKVLYNSKYFPVAGITSHHLPTAAPLINRFYSELKKRRPNIKRFIVIGPDHFEKCRKDFSYGTDKIQTAFGYAYPDKSIAEFIAKLGAKDDDRCFFNEHSIGVQANFIKRYFKDATINPIVLSYSARNRDFSGLQKYLNKNKDIFLVLSLDFSHYQTEKQANKIDEITKKKIENNNSRGLELKNVDSPATLKIALDYAKQFSLKPEIVLHKNSAEYDGDKGYTTSYFDVFFNK